MYTNYKVRNRFIFFFLFLFLITGVTYAQKPILLKDFSFEASDKYKHIKNLRTYQVASGNRLVSIKKGRKDMTVQRYSLKDLKEEIKKRQVIVDKGEFQTVMKLDNKAVVFYSTKNKAHAQKISLTALAAEKPILIGSDKEKIHRDFGFVGTHGFDSGGRINQFAFKKSFDGTKLLVLFRVKTGGDKPDKIGISVYDTELELLWKRKVTMPYPSNKVLNEDFALDNEGNFYMTASVFNATDTEKNKLKDTYRTEVFRIMDDPKDVIKSEIKLTGKAITDAIIKVDGAGKVFVTGLYAEEGNKKETSGIFNASINEEGTVDKVVSSDLPKDVVEGFVQKREQNINNGTLKKDDKLDLEDLKVNEVINRADGTLLFAEQRYVESFTTSSSSGSRTTYKHYYRDIFVLKLLTDGTIAWMHKLPKHQLGTRGKRSMSYLPIRNKGKVYLFYLDDFVNLKKPLDEIPTKYYDGKKEFIYLTTYVIDEVSGEVTKEPILTGSNLRNARLDVMELTKASILPNKDMFFEVFDGKKNNMLLKITPVK